MSKADGKRILVFGGWFGGRNAGDEAILLGCKKVLERADGNIAQAARNAQMNRSYLLDLLKRRGLR